jgi:uncharacterized peroxidase-related enzyme
MQHHGEALRRLVSDNALVAQLKEDFERADVRPEDEVMLEYVAKLTRTPARVEESDVKALREVGLSDRAILDLAQITAYFAFVTRMADGLGVTLEEPRPDR